MVVDKNRSWWLILFAGVLGLFAGFFVFPFLYGLSFDYTRFSLSPGEISSSGDSSGALIEGNFPGGHIKGITHISVEIFKVPIWNSDPSKHSILPSSYHRLADTIRTGTFSGGSPGIVVNVPYFFGDMSHDIVLSRKWDEKGHMYFLSPQHRADTSGRWDMEGHKYFLSNIWSSESHNMDLSFAWEDGGHYHSVSLVEPFSPIE